MKLKLNAITQAVVAGSMIASVGVAQAEWSSNVALSSEYVFRGISQTNEDPAISGGFDYESENGLYVGTWASNVDFGGSEHLEVDLYGGYGTELGNGFGLDIGFIHYEYYSDPDNINLDEIYLGTSYNVFSAQVSHDFDNDNTYIEASFDFELPNDIGLALHVGNYNFDAGGDYTDYSIGVSKEIGGFGFGLTYHDTDLDGDANADSRIVLAISR